MANERQYAFNSARADVEIAMENLIEAKIAYDRALASWHKKIEAMLDAHTILCQPQA